MTVTSNLFRSKNCVIEVGIIKNVQDGKLMAVVTAISAFYLPALLMVALYYQVYQGLQKRQRHLKSVSQPPQQQQQQNQTKPLNIPRTTLEPPAITEHDFDEMSIDDVPTESTLVPTRGQSGRESALSKCSSVDNMELPRHPTCDSLDRSDSCDNSGCSSKRNISFLSTACPFLLRAVILRGFKWCHCSHYQAEE